MTLGSTGKRPAGIRLAATLGLTATMTVVAMALGFALPTSAQPGSSLHIGLAAMIAISVAAELASIDRRIGDHTHTLSLSEVGLVVGLAFTGPGTLVMGRVVGGLLVLGVLKRIPTPKLAFNLALFALETTVAAVVFHLFVGEALVTDPHGWVALALAAAGATFVGLASVRTILRIHDTPRPDETTRFSLVITATGTTIGVLAVIALDAHTEAAIVVAFLCGIAFTVMRTITSLTQRIGR